MSSKYNLDSCLAILRESTSYREALEAIQQAYPGCTGAALRAAFARAELAAPSEYVAQAEPNPTAPAEWNPDPGPCPDPQPDRYWVDKTPEPPSPKLVDCERPYKTDYLPLDCGSKETERALIVADCHRPFHDKRAWATMLKAAKAYEPHTIIQLGDFWDAYCVSDHDRDPRRINQVEDELKDVREGLDELDSLGAQRKLITFGNHSFRLERYILRRCPELASMISLPKLLGLQERGWDWCPYREHRRIGRCYVTHEVGHCGVHAVHHTGQAFNSNVVFGHVHRLSTTYFGSVTGERHVAASLGWLGDSAAASYAHEAKRGAWQHGFGTMRIEKNGNVHLQAIPIVDGRCVLDGKLVSLA
jgi:hypothetical protein